MSAAVNAHVVPHSPRPRACHWAPLPSELPLFFVATSPLAILVYERTVSLHLHPLSLKPEVPLRDPHYHLIPYLPDPTFLQLKFRQDTTEVVDRTSTRSRMIKMTIFGRERGRLHLYLDGRIIRKTGGRENTRSCWSSWRRTGTTMSRWTMGREVCWEEV